MGHSHYQMHRIILLDYEHESKALNDDTVRNSKGLAYMPANAECWNNIRLSVWIFVFQQPQDYYMHDEIKHIYLTIICIKLL